MDASSPSVSLTDQERAALFSRYLPLAKSQAIKARALIGWRLSMDDALSAAMDGLWQSCQTFDPSLGIKFGTYARPRVYYNILDYVRDEYGRKGSRQESFVRKKVSLEFIRAKLALGEDDSFTKEPAVPHEESEIDVAEEVRLILSPLKLRSRIILRLYFVEGFTQEEIARVFGLVPTRIFQIIRRSLDFLKQRSRAVAG